MAVFVVGGQCTQQQTDWTVSNTGFVLLLLQPLLLPPPPLLLLPPPPIQLQLLPLLLLAVTFVCRYMTPCTSVDITSVLNMSAASSHKRQFYLYHYLA